MVFYFWYNSCMKNFYKLLLLAIVATGIGAAHTSAQQVDPNKCNQTENAEQCRKRLDEIAKEIKVLDGVIKKEDSTQKTLSTEINKLSGEIKKTSTEIKKKNSLIQNIKSDISSKEKGILDLNERLRREKESLQKILRKRHELADATLLEVLLSGKNISRFYEDNSSFSYIQGSLSDSFDSIKGLKTNIFKEKQTLEQKREEQDSAKFSLQVEQQKIQIQKKERDQALNVSKKKESSLAALKKTKEAEASKIRNKLFELRDVAGGGIDFGTAYQYAKEAGAKTGVRPAFILAILQQESNLGKNVGTCNRNNNEPTWKTIMPGPNSGSWRDDQTIFKSLMAKLGRPLVGTPLSCPIRVNGKYSGWGGAMGPSQFIPATWKSYENKVARAVGASIADPWNPRHAVHATAIYVSELGASAQTYAAERNAACKYYSGRGCSDPNVRNAFYGNGVVNKAIKIQANIDLIK